MRKPIARRDFLKLLAAGAGGLAAEQLLAACNAIPTEDTPAPTNTNPPPASEPTARTAGSTQAPTEVPVNAPDMVVVRGGEPDAMVRRALESFGGMGTFIPSGANVVIKPNICVAYHTYEYAATTNPWVVGALVKLCIEAGAGRVRVMDFPFGGSAESAYEVSGIREQVEAAGGEMEIMSRLKYAQTDIPDGQSLKRTDAYTDALNADVLIDVPIAKHHGSARLTLGMKNLMGLVLDRGALHNNLGQRIADLASLFRPTLTVIDAVRILTANGPTGGDLNDVQQLDTLIVSPDVVAADSYATRLFGLTPQDIAYIPAAAAMGLGRLDLENLNIEEVTLS